MSKMTKMQINRCERILEREIKKKVQAVYSNHLTPESAMDGKSYLEMGHEDAVKNMKKFIDKAYECSTSNNWYGGIAGIFNEMPTVKKIKKKFDKINDDRDEACSKRRTELRKEADAILDKMYLGGAEEALALLEAFKEL